jgi:hypothetical protein
METIQRFFRTELVFNCLKNESFIKRFMEWAEHQDKYRFGWLGIIVAGNGCFITPATVFVVLYTGNNLFLFMAALTVFAISFVANLAAMPTKITIPIFCVGLLADILIILVALALQF